MRDIIKIKLDIYIYIYPSFSNSTSLLCDNDDVNDVN